MAFVIDISVNAELGSGFLDGRSCGVVCALGPRSRRDAAGGAQRADLGRRSEGALNGFAYRFY